MFRLFSRSAPTAGSPRRRSVFSGAGNDGGPLADPIGLNVFVLPAEFAYPFIAYCYANYASGSVVDFSDPGSPCLLAETPASADVRMGASEYDVMQGGRHLRKAATLIDEWGADSVAVGIGCSVIVDRALAAWGVRPKHVERSAPLAVYETTIETRAVGPFRARQYVSMRIVKKWDADLAAAVAARFPALHGGPVHIGHPADLGIEDLGRPVLGTGLSPDADEVCLFWGCGVTLRAALATADVPWIANAEGHLVGTRLPISALRADVPKV